MVQRVDPTGWLGGFNATTPASPLGTHMADISGPFFLGYSFEFFGMGVVLILSVNYFTTMLARPKVPTESSHRVGMILVAVSLAFNIAQTATDFYRGWTLFAVNFSNLQAIFVPTFSYFLSPFFGLFPAVITQGFLLRRSCLFIASLGTFWPRLARTRCRCVFTLAVGLMILVSAGAGTISSVFVWKAGRLWKLNRDSDVSWGFKRAELCWLTTSAFIDLALSVVLCFELWWARTKLASKGGAMRQVLTYLLLVTFNGGLAVTAIQMSTLLVYSFAKFSSWSYFPMIALSKVYSVTLLLSLTVPHGQGTGHSPSHVFSLPTITSLSPPTVDPDDGPPAGPSRSVDVSDSEEKGRRSMQAIWKAKRNVQRGWRKRQQWLGSNLTVAGNGKGKDSSQQNARDVFSRHLVFEARFQDPVERLVNEAGQRVSPLGRALTNPQTRSVTRFHDHRRPSEPSSLIPLLSPSTSSRRPSTLALTRRVSRFQNSSDDVSPTLPSSRSHEGSSGWTYPYPNDRDPEAAWPSGSGSTLGVSAIPTPPRSIVIDRPTIIVDRRRSLPNPGELRGSMTFDPNHAGGGEDSTHDRAIMQRPATSEGIREPRSQVLFHPLDPFASLRSENYATSSLASTSSTTPFTGIRANEPARHRPSIFSFPLSSSLTVPPLSSDRSRHRPRAEENVVDLGEEDEAGGGRKWSFVDMLGEGPEDDSPARRRSR